jgi:hypothetical protein
MTCCNTNYLGVFCTDQSTTVFGFSTMKNGVITTQYFNTSDNTPYVGTVVFTCQASAGGGGGSINVNDSWGNN